MSTKVRRISIFMIIITLSLIMLSGCGSKGGFVATTTSDDGSKIEITVVPNGGKIKMTTKYYFDTEEQASFGYALLKMASGEIDDVDAKRSGKEVSLIMKIAPDEGKTVSETIAMQKQSLLDDGTYTVRDI